MSRYSICVIGVYFGKLPAYFNLWLKSCKHNPDVDFLIVTDNDLTDLPKNVRSYKMSLAEMKKRADSALGFETALTTAYKCCDFKVVYGNIFADLIEQYDFWGHCDFDLIFGDLRKFVTDDILEKNDKIFDLGHLTLYRNNSEVKERYKCAGSRHDYKKVFTSTENYAFDEIHGIYRIYKLNNFPMYIKKVYADIFSLYPRFKVVHIDKNYKHQTFYWENGQIIMAYEHKGTIRTREFAYIHFQKRGFASTLPDSVNSFYISKTGFTHKTSVGVPDISEIKKSNPYNIIEEFFGFLAYNKRFVKKKHLALKRRLGKFFK